MQKVQRNSHREIPGIVEQELQVRNEVNISWKIHQFSLVEIIT